MNKTDMTQGFTMTRMLDATPEEIWHAWTNPDAIAEWWHPRNTSTPREEVEVDLRSGGHYRYTMINDSTGDRIVSGGVYLELDPPRRLVFTWGDTGSDPQETPVIAVSLEPAERGTMMTFELRGVHGEPGDEFFYDGWAEVLDVFEEHLS